jgi:hypothetical protein
MATIFQKLCEKYELNDYLRAYGQDKTEYTLWSGDCPCFTRRADCPEVMEEKDMVPYLKACARETIGVVMLSTTEREPMHEQWLKAAEQVKASIIPGRSTEHGGYKVWLICLTGTAKA